MAIWRMIPHHQDRETAIAWCREHSAVSIGWGDIGDLRNLDPEAISNAVTHHYGREGSPGTASPSLQRFLAAKTGDIVVLRGDVSDYLVEITSPYRFALRTDSIDDYQHQRSVRFTGLDPDEYWNGKLADKELVLWAFARVSESVPRLRDRLLEGSRYELTTVARKRSKIARDECIALHGCRCMACGMSFEDMYGEIGEGFIHVHHLDPLGHSTEERDVDPERDLVPLCANCHAMVHQRPDPFTIDELRTRIRSTATVR